MTTSSDARPGRLLAVLATAAVAGTTLVAPHAAFAADDDVAVTHDAESQQVLASADGVDLVVDYSDGVRVSSLMLNGSEVLDDGAWSALEPDGSAALDSRTVTDASVAAADGSAIVTFAMANDAVTVTETWTLTADSDGVDLETAREYDWADESGGTIVHNGQLQLDWSRVFDNIRRPGDGGNIPIGNDYAGSEGFFLNKENDRYGVELSDVVLLSQKLDAGLAVTATSDDRDLATEFAYTGDSTSQETQVSTADRWEYTAGTYESGLVYGGHSSTETANDIYAAQAVADGQRDAVDFRFAATDRASFYDLGGTIPGIEDPAAFSSLLNDFGRSGMIDENYGMSTVGSRYPGTGPYDMVFADRTVLGYDDPEMRESQKGLLEYFRDYGQADSGHMNGRTFHRKYEWRDNTLAEADPVYALSVATMFEATDDREWLDGMHGSVTEAMDFMFRERFHADRSMFHNGILDCDDDKGSREWNDAFFVCNESAYVNEMMYAALDEWSIIEREIYGDAERADRYAATAAGLKETFNKDGADGGLWSEETGAFAFWRETDGALKGDVQQIQVNLRAIFFGMVDRDRAIQILDGIDEQMAKNDLPMLPMNFWPIHENDEWRGDHFQTGLEDGAIYPLMTEEYMRAAAVVGERERGVEYMNNAIDRYAEDGYIGYSYVTWAGDPKKQEEWFPTNANVAGGMYLDVLGIQPTREGLTLAPNLPKSVNGAEVTREVHPGEFATIRYNNAIAQTVDYTAEGRTVTMKWSGQEPGNRYVAIDNGARTDVVADDMGIVEYAFDADGTHKVRLAKGDVDGYVLPEREPANLARGGEVTASSSFEDGEWYSTDRLTDGNRFSGDWTTGWSSDSEIDQNHSEWVQVDLGKNQKIGKIELLPRNYDGREIAFGFPNDFRIEVSKNGKKWTTVAEEEDYPTPTERIAPTWEFEPENARYVRVTGTDLTTVDDEYRMQFAELTAR